MIILCVKKLIFFTHFGTQANGAGHKNQDSEMDLDP